MSQRHILIADDDHDILLALKFLLTSENYRVTLASTPLQVIELVKQNDYSALLLDLNFNLDTTSGEEGLAVIEQITKLALNLPIVVMTGWATVELAVAAMQKGACDFVQKPWDNERLLSIIRNQIALASQKQENEKLNVENQLLKAQSGRNQAMIAESEAMQQLLSTAEQVAKSDVNVLITGENGTGKSLLAEYIHNCSNRAQHSLIQVNMGAIAENLFESEMFGHIKGAFTDARENRIGRFELAHHGSLFLDEIGNIPISQQAKLLRVLESQQFERVGSSKTQQVDVRIIAATNADIGSLIEAGDFRQDLFYRLNSIELTLPSLAKRQADIIPLTEHYLTQFCQKYQKDSFTITASAKQALISYHWPGNIRELNHLIERAVILSSTNQIDITQLNLSLASQEHPLETCIVNETEEFDQPLSALEKAIIERRIAHFHGNMSQAAKSLGLSRSAFYRRIEKF
ncbi:sigma-54-dependent Fis family transcriptional regulator [Thalassotalea sp. M1531]|uniref:Sigma-54-dependent Fis family transcriptional regulator n=1 Tax=Thalassotalea algicola TaxID=2716224 RepID=A0A7Y0L9Y4_9GAMM|nr:sigma-54 dependent transcriptional regulator [Thalassotalea algicola]NMP30688.1 sigma-54-dependent Fis family transcriptional regulator [Thalassotalea algicola]